MLGLTQRDNRPIDVAEGFQDAFGGGSLGGNRRATRFQANDSLVTELQLTTDTEFGQNQDTQGQNQQPGQGRNALLVMKKNRADMQFTCNRRDLI